MTSERVMDTERALAAEELLRRLAQCHTLLGMFCSDGGITDEEFDEEAREIAHSAFNLLEGYA